MSSEPPCSRSPLATDANAGKVAIVTGAGTGIGRAAALELGRTGARLVLCGRREHLLDETRRMLEVMGAEALVVPVDLREPENAVAVVDRSLERFGAIDLLINVAGGQFSAPAEAITPNGWRAVFRLSLDVVWYLTREVATRSMIPRRHGVVIFVGFSPRRGVPSVAHSAAARAGLENLAGTLAAEWSRYGIRAICLALGSFHSGVFLEPGRAEEHAPTVPLGRVAMPAEAGTVIAFPTSAGAAYITGTAIAVDGGREAWGLARVPPPALPPENGELLPAIAV